MNISRKHWIALLVAAVILLLLPVAGYFGFSAFKTWRAQNLAAEALVLAENRDEAALREAWEKARAAHRLRPENLDVVRAVAHIYLLMDPESAAAFWQQAVQLSEGAFEDYDSWVKATILAADFASAEAVIQEMEAAFPGHIEVGVRRIQLQVARGDIDEAVTVARELTDHSAAGPEHQFLFVDTTQLAADPRVRRAGIEHLRALARHTDAEVAMRAAQRLGRMEGALRNDRLFAADALATHGVRPEDRLLRLEILLELEELTAEDVARSAQAAFDLNDPSQKVAYARWLNTQGLHGETLQHVSAQEALQRQDLFLIYLDALAMTQQWADIEALLRERQAPLTPVFEELFRMRTQIERDEQRRADIAWGRTLLAAGRNPESLWFIAQYTRRLGLLDYSAEALEKMAEQPALRDSALAGLLEVYRDQKDTQALRSVLQRIHTNAPDNEAVINDLAYFNLLAGEHTRPAKATAEAQMEAYPHRLAPKMTYALALYREGRETEALAFLEQIPVDWNEVGFRWRLVVATILAANGQEEQAFEFIRDHPLQDMFPEERQMLRDRGLL